MARNIEIEIQMLHGPDGKVIFMECGSDFVELMFGIMKAPLSSLVGVCPHEDDVHPFMSIRKSLSDLGKQSFINNNRPDDALAKPIDFSLTPKTTSGGIAQYPPPGYTKVGTSSLRCQSCTGQFNPTTYPSYSQQCPLCNKMHGNVAIVSQPMLKDNCKFMVTDSLKVFEASMVKAMELIKNKANGFGEVKTSSATVTEECVKKLILRSMLGSKTVLTDLFGDSLAAKNESAEGESISSFELFGG